MDTVIPRGPRLILERLEAAGFEAFLVGGCVRDLCRGVAPHDWDICTSAEPTETMAVFAGERVLPTGLRHGTVTVLLDGKPFEVTSFRTDGGYSDGRHPDSVRFVRNLSEDLQRRDFTINSMAMASDGTVRDPFGGEQDLMLRLIRCVGEPERRFSEDGLRVMRALRFASALDFSIEPKTGEALRRAAPMLRKVAAERIQTELFRLLTGPGAGCVLREFPEPFAVFWPELSPGAERWDEAVRAVETAPPDLILRLGALLSPVEGDAETLLRRLRAESSLVERVTALVRNRNASPPEDDRSFLRLLSQLGPETFFDVAALNRWETAVSRARTLLSEGACLSIRDLAVDGRDVLALGVSPGPEVGRVLHRLLDAVLDGEPENKKEPLLKRLREMLDGDGYRISGS